MVKSFIFFSLMVVFMFSGCSMPSLNLFKSSSDPTLDKVRKGDYHDPYAKTNRIYQDLNGAIYAIADELFTSNTNKDKNTSVILTSFVDLNQLNKTTTFGRLLGESMFNELHIRNFKIIDFRGQDAVSVNGDGEFHLTRDVEKLKDHIEAVEYVVVGTYVKFEEKNLLINARILDSETGEVISTARIIYHPVDCKLFDLCYDKAPRRDNGISITTDGCSVQKCPTRQCLSGICQEEAPMKIISDKCNPVNCPTQTCKDGICDNSSLY